MIQVVEYEDERGRHPFSEWFEALNTPAVLKVRTAIARLENGNFSNVEPVGEGVGECKIHFGPGYRNLLRQGRIEPRDFAGRRDEEATES